MEGVSLYIYLIYGCPGSSVRHQTRPTALRRETASASPARWCPERVARAGGARHPLPAAPSDPNTPARLCVYFKTEGSSGNGEKSGISKGRGILKETRLFLLSPIRQSLGSGRCWGEAGGTEGLPAPSGGIPAFAPGPPAHVGRGPQASTPPSKTGTPFPLGSCTLRT